MKIIFSLVFLFASLTFASNDFASFKKSFESSAEPKVENIGGWYTGRCYTSRLPDTEKAGLLVIATSLNPVTGSEELKIIMPAGSVRNEVDFWDQLNDEKIEIASSMMWPENMEAAKIENGSLSNILVYDVPNAPSGKLSLRQGGQKYQLRFGDIYGESEWIFCQMDKKVRF